MTSLEAVERDEQAFKRGGPIPPENWDAYGRPWRRIPELITGAQSPYETFINLPCSGESWEITKRLIPKIIGGTAIDLGCGPGKKFFDILNCSRARSLVALDFSPVMLAQAEQEAKRISRQSESEITVVRQDVTIPWGINTKADLIIADFLICWLSSQGRVSVFEQMNQHLADEGSVVVGFRNEKWRDDTVKRHILEEAKRNPRATIGALFGAKPHVAAMGRMKRSGKTDAGPPTREEIMSLLNTNKFKIIEEKETLWPDDSDGGKGTALLLRRSNFE